LYVIGGWYPVPICLVRKVNLSSKEHLHHDTPQHEQTPTPHRAEFERLLSVRPEQETDWRLSPEQLAEQEEIDRQHDEAFYEEEILDGWTLNAIAFHWGIRDILRVELLNALAALAALDAAEDGPDDDLDERLMELKLTIRIALEHDHDA
jgi:hypothetical protein